jgi:hypothetical protein
MKLEKKIYTTRAEKQRDLAIGIGVFIGLNVLLYAIGALVASLLPLSGISQAESLIPLISLCLSSTMPFLINIGVLVYFALTRAWIALGMVAAFGFLMILALILGVIASIVCLATGI